MHLLSNNVPDTVNPTSFFLWGATYTARQTWGFYFDYWVETPIQFRIGGDQGQFCSAQLAIDNSSYTTTTQTVGSGYTGEFLDGHYPYGKPPYNRAETYWCPASNHIINGVALYKLFGDRPGLGNDNDPLLSVEPYLLSLNVDMSFRMFVMYYPPYNGIGSLDAPMHQVNWKASGSAAVGPPWSFSDTGSAVTGEDAHPSHPQWTQVKS